MSALRNAVVAGLGLGLAVVMPAAAVAANGYATTDVNERAGPGTDYPVVALIPGGAPLTIFGCLTEVAWCDVAYAGERGWVQGSYLQALYETQRVAVPAYAPRLGIPIVTFNIVVYWGDYYRHRPFYRERSRFVRLNGAIGHTAYRSEPISAIPGARGPQYAPGAPPKQFAKIRGPNRLRYAKYGKGPKQAVLKARVKPAFVKGKPVRLVAKKPPPKRCRIHDGRPMC
jgi:uncharacterized protein YraI